MYRSSEVVKGNQLDYFWRGQPSIGASHTTFSRLENIFMLREKLKINFTTTLTCTGTLNFV